jgi:hypothetical protein
MWRIDICE